MDNTRRQQIDRLLRDASYYLLECLPTGIDPKADVDNTKPEDATAHYAGLAWQQIQTAIKLLQGP